MNHGEQDSCGVRTHFAQDSVCEVKLPTGIIQPLAETIISFSPLNVSCDFVVRRRTLHIRSGSSVVKNLLRKLWNDQAGMIVSSEIILVGTILVLGSIAGLTSLHYALNAELNDAANAVESMGGGRGDTYSLSDSEGVPEVSGDGTF